MNEENLCCCEYINEDGERSHLLATLCNCEAIDEAFDRLITRRELRPELTKKIIETLEDRFRIPWANGAKKIPASYVLPFIFNCILIYLGSINHYLTLITYLIILPLVIFSCHRFLKAKRRIYYVNPKSFTRSDLQSNFMFYVMWSFSIVILLLYVFYAYVIASMKISSLENLLFVFLFVSMCASLYIVVRKGQLVIESSRETGEDSLYSLKTCSRCSLESYTLSSHCSICGACFTMRDHHCLWLNICIGQENEIWFLASLILALSCLLYGSLLTFTTVCNPRILNVGPLEILYPYRCPNAYFDFSSSIMYSAGCYSVLLMACILCVLLNHVCWLLRRMGSGQKNKVLKPFTSLCRFLGKFILKMVDLK